MAPSIQSSRSSRPSRSSPLASSDETLIKEAKVSDSTTFQAKHQPLRSSALAIPDADPSKYSRRNSLISNDSVDSLVSRQSSLKVQNTFTDISSDEESISIHQTNQKPNIDSIINSGKNSIVNSEEDDEEEEEDDDSYSNSNIPPQLMEKLSKFPLFKNAPLSFHKTIATRLRLMQHHAQEYIVKFGEPAKAMYWILRGSVAVTSPDGEAVHAELVAGQFFGEIGILFNRPRTATVIARTKVLLAVLTVDNFNAVLPDFPFVERMIRDEAQERLSMQDKRKRNGVTNIISNNFIKDRRDNNQQLKGITNSSPIDKDLVKGEIASSVANVTSLLPGPSIPPQIPSKLLQKFPVFNTDLGKKKSLPQIHDNVDHSIPTKDFLRSLPMFTLLPSNIIHELVLGVEPRRFEPFEYIVKKGDLGRDIFFIVEGEVEVLHPNRISLISSDGDKDKKVERVIARLSSGQYFGEMAFLNSISNHDKLIERSADIRSISTVDLLVVTGDQLENLYSRYPRICDEMRETAAKRLNRNKDTEEDELKIQDSPFNKWKGFQSSTPTDSENPSTDKSKFFAPTTKDDSSSLMKPASPNHVQSALFKDSFLNSVPPATQTVSAPSYQRKRSIASLSPTISPISTDAIKPTPLTLSLPPSNPPTPSLNEFPHQRSQPTFQYMNHAKRLRLASISGSAHARRRSSVLSTGFLPDRLLLQVFKFLNLPELMKLRIICRRWRQLLYVAPGFFETLDLRPFNTTIDDRALIQITDFVGSRPKVIDISDCFHITDVGFCYMVNEIGMSGSIQIIKMRSVWDVSAMAIMDLAVPSVGKHIEQLDLSNCRKVGDNVLERIVGWNGQKPIQAKSDKSYIDDYDPIPGMEEFDDSNQVGCKNLKHLNLGYCKHLTDRSMYHIALYASDRLESLDITRCTTITDAGFAYWAYQPFPHLKKLKMSDCTFLTDKSIISIASSSQSLEFLDLSFCCALTDVSIEVLCLGCSNLKHLDLSFCGSAISDSTLLAISIHLRNLESLIIRGCVRVTRAGVDALISSSIPLRYLDISQCRNAHFYRDNTPAAEIKPRPNSKSAFVSTTHDNVVEIVI